MHHYINRTALQCACYNVGIYAAARFKHFVPPLVVLEIALAKNGGGAAVAPPWGQSIEKSYSSSILPHVLFLFHFTELF